MKQSELSDLEALRSFLGLPTYLRTPSNLSDQDNGVVFISIDIENAKGVTSKSQSSRCQAGISILDSEDITTFAHEATLTTHNLATSQSPSSRKFIDRKFLFGKTHYIPFPDLARSIEQLLERSRNIVLVGHGFGSDLSALRALGIDLQSSIVGIFDTAMIRNQVLGPSPRNHDLILRRLLQRVGCPFAHLHIGGNDPNFTLRALLLLAADSYRLHEGLLDDAARRRLDVIRSIGQTPLPALLEQLQPGVEIPLKNAAVKKKRTKRKREGIIRAEKIVRTLDEQEQLREERRAKKRALVQDELAGWASAWQSPEGQLGQAV
jgi:hypothetical protein